MITKDYVEEIFKKIKSPPAYEFFFDNLNSAEWIEPLMDYRTDIFKKPVPAVKTDNGWMFPWWPESRYLARVANQDPERIVGIIKSLEETDNCRVHEDFADAILKMPIRFSKQVLAKVLTWMDDRFLFLLPEKLAQYSINLAQSGDTANAIKVLDRVLKLNTINVDDSDDILFRKNRIVVAYDDYVFFEILKDKVPELVKLCGDRAVEVIYNKFKLILVTEKYEGESDHSIIWRREIEHAASYSSDSLISKLFDCLRDSYEVLLKESSPEDGEAQIRKLIDSKQGILMRLGLYFLIRDKWINSNLALEIIQDQKYFENSVFWHEFSTFLERKFPLLDMGMKKNIENIIASYQFVSGDGGFNEDITAREKIRFYMQLGEHISDDASKDFENLKSKYGLLEDSKFHTSEPEIFYGPTSPVEKEKLMMMTSNEIVEYLKGWQPKGEWMEASPEGLGRVLQELVIEDPNKGLEIVKSFAEIPLTYIRHIVTGLSNSKKEFNRNELIIIFQSLLKHDYPVKHKGLDEDLGLSWTKKEIARFIHSNLDASKFLIQFREEIWWIIDLVSEDQNPDLDDEEKNLDLDDCYGYAINTTRGEGLECVISYGLWIKRELKIPDSQALKDFAPEVQMKLAAHLDLADDPNLSIRSVYGRWLPWIILLDKGWVKSNLAKIFPETEATYEYRKAAWQTYILYCGVFDPVFDLLKDEYAFQIEELKKDFDSQISKRRDPRLRLSEHLIVLYGRGKIDFDEGSLLELFFKNAGVSEREHAISFIGKSMKNDKANIPAHVIERFQRLWDWRKQQPIDIVRNELTEFGWWVASGKFEDSWILEELKFVLGKTGWLEGGYTLLNFLKKNIQKYPELTLDVLTLYLEGPIKIGKVYLSKDKILPLLLEMKKHLPKGKEKDFTNIIDILFSCGFKEFRELAKP